jgi:RNA polymerase sigma-70 factor (ECF subfamily)
MEVNVNLSEKAQRDYMLVQRATNGDQRAFAELMDRYRDAIYYMLLKMVNNQSDAEDLTIEAFGKAFQNLDSYTPKFAFSTWLFRIATNNCVDFIRKKQMSPAPYDGTLDNIDNVTVNIQSDLPDPEESLINHQKISALKDIIGQLKPRYRTLIQLRYYKEYSYEEISAELKIPLGTVKAELYRAKTLLYNILIKTDNR